MRPLEGGVELSRLALATCLLHAHTLLTSPHISTYYSLPHPESPGLAPKTGAQGQFYRPLAPGKYHITITAPGYQKIDTSVTVPMDRSGA